VKMDKTELNYKVSQIKKLVNKSDYATAMKIADTIDWRQIRNQATLAMASRVYEKNGEYQDARDILLIAYERSSIGRGILRKLCDLALRAGDVKEAEAYYREYCDQVDDDDATQYLLRYLILEAKKAPIEQQVNALEMYCNMELDDKWMYHLAELYQKAGREEDCVRMCDKIMLMFGLGKYVDRAMELKIQYAPLSKYQMDLVENREKYEQRLREVQEKYSSADDADDEVQEEAADDSGDAGETADAEADAPGDSLPEDNASDGASVADTVSDSASPDDVTSGDADAAGISADGDETPSAETSAVPETDGEASAAEGGEMSPAAADSDMALAASLHEAKAEEELAREVSRMQSETASAAEEPEISNEETKIFHSVRDTEAAASEEPSGSAAASPMKMPELRFTLAVDAEADAKTLKTRVGDTLRTIQGELGVSRKVKGIQSASLNNRGVETFLRQLEGADVAVLGAGDLGRNTLADLNGRMDGLAEQATVVLVDSQEKLEKLRGKYPDLLKEYDEYTDSEETAKKIRDAAAAVKAEQEAARAAEKAAEARAAEKAAEEQAAAERAAQQAAAKAAEARKAAEAKKAEEAARAEAEAAALREKNAAEEKKTSGAEQTAAEPEDSVAAARALAEKKAEAARKAIAEAEAARKAAEEALRAAEEAERELDEEQPENDGAVSAAVEKSEENLPEDDGVEEGQTSPVPQGGEMDIDAFVQYACEYAVDCDCSIDGKAKLALYERAEMMEDDGIPLTRENAVDLIERAADKAEKKKLFSRRYDKNGYLILKEKNFFD
jgi:hypothetical protein